jgi:hypothetical protein
MHFKKEEKYNNLGYNSNQLNKLVLFESYEKMFKKKGATIINGKTYIKKKINNDQNKKKIIHYD